VCENKKTCSTAKVYHEMMLTLNLVMPGAFLILTEEASFRRAVRRKSLISLICLGCKREKGIGKVEETGGSSDRGEKNRSTTEMSLIIPPIRTYTHSTQHLVPADDYCTHCLRPSSGKHCFNPDGLTKTPQSNSPHFMARSHTMQQPTPPPKSQLCRSCSVCPHHTSK
jgi:hypothetical protein